MNAFSLVLEMNLTIIPGCPVGPMSPCKVQRHQCQTIEEQKKDQAQKEIVSTLFPFGPLDPLRPVISEPSAAMELPGSPFSPFQMIQ